jgi:hypothetical protein
MADTVLTVAELRRPGQPPVYFPDAKYASYISGILAVSGLACIALG